MGKKLNLPAEETPQPFLKWAGGKRSLIPIIQDVIRPFSGTYIEPFVGAGAVMFSMPLSRNKIISDFNEELINVYRVISNDVDGLLAALSTHTNTKEHFLNVRAMDREPDFPKLPETVRAARFIFLNKTCFNGLYRVNSSGYFNVPFGFHKNPDFVNETVLRKAANFLNGEGGQTPVQIMSGDFTGATAIANSGDFVYFDPPYVPLSPTSSFVSYGELGFSLDDQLRLRDEAKRLIENGVQVVISNSDTEIVRDLYSERDFFKISKVQVRRSIGASSASRGTAPEVLISSRDQGAS